ncbi:hypothetical protein [Candidatus Liberibacter americanus]|uniref:Uncharacterized protein n=1 Tax=Candidatus Liberibacter americanus str. Sao Paulo TaxID=1261131 RepID=U6B7K0_9HYPH|nr:hypothetical protein [Candidatus Liberibacter americanus]AHA27841.1 hypothetical protein lam_482 [Candidatus Liberibacter americanus str. Sao Paulo]EMS36009.1 hypothetical protein G653_03850 [Candidatus Liberibacter americanus PW_SP]
MTKQGEKCHKKKSKGRPCKEGVSRTNSGRISRSKKINLSPITVVQEARMRLFGLTALQSAQAEGGSRIGRLRITGKISPEQYQAFVCFANQYNQYMQMIQAPDSLKRSGEFKSQSYSEEEDTKRRLSIKKHWLSLKKSIEEAQVKTYCNLWKSLNYFISRDDGIMSPTPLNLIVNLCHATDALISHYGIPNIKDKFK